jgi:hypothetical protein
MSVAGFDCGDGSSITAGVELGHGGFGEVAAVGDLPFVVHVGQHGADEADDGGSLVHRCQAVRIQLRWDDGRCSHESPTT